MNDKVAKFSSRETIAEEAAEWLILLDRGQPPSDDELSGLHAWMEESRVHREELLSLARLWEKMNVLTELAVPLGVADQSPAQPKPVRSGRLRWATAAVVIIAVTLFFSIARDPDPNAANGLYATAIGQQQSTTLPDGSSILLNTDSQVRVEYEDDFRNIYLLQGEALFEVSRDKDRPFRVYAGDGRIEAVGTAFSVYLRNNAVDVTVTEGKVLLSTISQHQIMRDAQAEAKPGLSRTLFWLDNDGQAVKTLGFLERGQSTTIQPGMDMTANPQSTLGEIVTIDEQELSRRISWSNGVLTFSGESLETVVEEFSRYTTMAIEISDPKIRAIKIGGRFPIGRTEEMLESLETNFGLSVTQLAPNHVVVAAAESP